jgi:Caspase domain/WG containing repeat
MKLLILNGCIALCCTTAYAQNKTVWALAPNPVYNQVEPFSQGIAQVRVGEKWHYLSPDSDTFKLSSDSYSKAEAYSCGFALVLEDGKYQFRNAQGDLVGKKYKVAHSYSDGFAAVQKAGEDSPVELYGFINKKGKKEIPYLYMYVGNFSEKWFPVVLNPTTKLLMIDTSGNKVQTNFNNIEVFSEGLAYAYDNNNHLGYVNSELKPVTDFKKGRYGRSFSEGFAPMSDTLPDLNYIDKEGKIAFRIKGGTFSKNELKKEEDGVKMDIHKFSEGLAAVRYDNKWGYINKNGGWAIRPKYQKVTRFSEGVAAVMQGNEWFFINKKDSIVQKDGFLEAKPCSNGKAWVKVKMPEPSRETAWGLIAFDNTRCEMPNVTISAPYKDAQTLISLNNTFKASIISNLELSSIEIRVNGHLCRDSNRIERRHKDTVFVEQPIGFAVLGKQQIHISATNLCGQTSASRIVFCDTTIQYHALLIANNTYPRTKDNHGRVWGTLTYPISDATTLSKILKTDYQFETVEVAQNVDRNAMMEVLPRFAKKHTHPNDHLLIFYAGHGSNKDNNSCLILSDNSCFDCNDLIQGAIQMDAVNQVLFIVDACYGGSFVLDKCHTELGGGLRGDGGGTDTLTQADKALKKKLAQTDSLSRFLPGVPKLPKARYIMTSGDLVPVSDKSVFFEILITILKNQETEMTAGDLKEEIVKKMPDINQHPQYNMLPSVINKGGYFVFRKKT